MKYILIGTILGSLVTSSHDSEEACKGRQAMLLKEKSIMSECYKEPQTGLTISSPTVICGPNWRQGGVC